MPSRKRSPELTFTVGGVSERHLSSLDDALAEAAKLSIAMDGKSVGVYIHASTREAAFGVGGEKAAEIFDNSQAGESVGVIYVKVAPPTFY
jgi:hypothetical protein